MVPFIVNNKKESTLRKNNLCKENENSLNDTIGQMTGITHTHTHRHTPTPSHPATHPHVMYLI